MYLWSILSICRIKNDYEKFIQRLMENLINIQKTFEKVVVLNGRINHREFEDCIFKQCDFSNSDFSNNVFMDCVFMDCNLSNLKLMNTSLKTVVFQNCKLIGLPFHTCNDFLFSVEFA